MKKKLIITLLLVIGLVSITVEVTFAFFNYTRTGSENTLSVGRIYFNHTQNGKIELSNIFPVNKNNLNSTNSDTVTINITGDTTYTEGIEYKVTLEEVNNTINGKEVPISIKATATNLGTEDSNYYTNRENKTNIYILNEEGEAYNGKYIAVGYIPAGTTGVNGSIDITAFIDTNKVAITDTIENGPIEVNNYDNGTTNDWVMGREVFTTSEWNSFTSTPLSFKIKVEANEGIWVEPEKFLTMKNLNTIQEWKDIRATITSIEFHKDGVVPANPITSFDVTDESSDPAKGNITLYTVDDGLGNNTYKAIAVANDTIYAPKMSYNLFRQMYVLTKFDSKNFKTDNVTNIATMFFKCYMIKNIDFLSSWNTSKVTNMMNLFRQCNNLQNINGIENWNVEKVEDMRNMFCGCVNIVEINLKNWKTSSLIYMGDMFGMWNDDGTVRLDSKLKNIYLSSEFNTSRVIDMGQLVANNKYIEDYSFLTYLDTTNVNDMSQMFQNNVGLTDLSIISNWNVQNSNSFHLMFNGCINLTNVSTINDWNIKYDSNFINMFKNTPSHPEFTKFPNGTWDSNGTFTPNA